MWYYLYDSSTGTLISETSTLPASGNFISRTSRMDASQETWDATGRRIIAAMTPAPSADETLRQSLVAQAPATATLAQLFQALQLVLKTQRF